jgi:hypothetical protein
MNILSGLAIFLLGASAGSILRYFQDRKLLRLYRDEAQRSIQALLEVMSAYEGGAGRKSAIPSAEAGVGMRSGSVRSA